MSMHRWLMVAAATAGALLAWACGSDGNDNNDLTGSGNDAGASSGSTSSSGAASGSSSGTTSGSSSGSSGADGATSSGAAGGDGGINPADAGPGGSTTTINCGATSCNLSTDVCCVSQVQGGLAYACAGSAAGCPANDAGGGGGDNGVTTLKCTSQANCAAGTVCCVTQTTAGAASECKATCGSNEEQLCDPKAADGGGCAPAKPCSNDGVNDFGLPKTFGICGGG